MPKETVGHGGVRSSLIRIEKEMRSLSEEAERIREAVEAVSEAVSALGPDQTEQSSAEEERDGYDEGYDAAVADLGAAVLAIRRIAMSEAEPEARAETLRRYVDKVSRRLGLEESVSAAGDSFDASTMAPVGQTPTRDRGSAGRVSACVAPGVLFGGRAVMRQKVNVFVFEEGEI